MNKKHHLDIDVLTAAKKRIKNALFDFDACAVAFSGGKDSLATLKLVDEVRKENNMPGKTKVFFRDEELIPETVISFVQSIYESGEYEFYYYAIPLESQKYILGDVKTYVQWDKNRKHLREPPQYAITLKNDEYRILDQYSTDEFIAKNFSGSVAFFTGMRASESLNRLNMFLKNTTMDNYIHKKTKRVATVCPLYDWEEDDIFLYFFKAGIRYCSIYDQQMLNNEELRVATPLHSEAAKRLYKIKTRDPVFYQQLIDLFPEMIVQERYQREYKNTSNTLKPLTDYPPTAQGVLNMIYDNVADPHQAKIARQQALKAISARENALLKNEGAKDNFGGYPLLYIMEQIANGSFKRYIKVCLKSEMKPQYFEFEGIKNAV
jgi:predicted phosphoadenosine phosphosulfate sulfurtransferase